jgi:aspartate-semialdehyde dehydrogenase
MVPGESGERFEGPVRPLPTAVLGATGLVGQRLVTLLEAHPWFELIEVAASPESVGRHYGEVARWCVREALPARVADLKLRPVTDDFEARVVFSALAAAVAGPAERALAAAGSWVFSNAASHRMHPAVPLLVGEVNADHLALTARQDFGPGGIVANPNCTTAGLVLALAPLAHAFGLRRVQMVSMQARSGAGLVGGAGLQLRDNLIPHIAGEEEKVESEAARILGTCDGESVRPHALALSASCNRVDVPDGHTLCVSVELERPASASELIEAWDRFRGEPQALGLPTAPRHPTRYDGADDAPQPALHVDLEAGMRTTIGRLRPCAVLDWKFTALSHNTLRGAAGGALLCAELALARGLVPLG